MNSNAEAQVSGIEHINTKILLAIIHEMHLALILHDAQHRVVFVNKTAETMFEGSFAEAYGMTPKEFGRHEVQELTQALNDSLETGTKSPYLEFPYQTRSGKYRYLKGCSVPIQDSQGQVTHAAILIQDMTRSHQLEGEAIMAAKLSSIADMAYNLAHEINNPLTGIKLGLSTLNRALEKHENINVLKSVMKDLNRIQGITNSFLQARKSPFRPKRARLNLIAGIIEDVEFHLSGRLIAKGITIEKCTWDDDLYVFVDRDRMYQVFLNSFLNAIHAITAIGTITIRKRIVSESFNKHSISPMLCISIADTGTGLDPSHKKELFERFHSSRPGGSGLGLYICKDIISAHSGKMELESEAGKGTTVKIYLPVTFE